MDDSARNLLENAPSMMTQQETNPSKFVHGIACVFVFKAMNGEVLCLLTAIYNCCTGISRNSVMPSTQKPFAPSQRCCQMSQQ